MHVLWFGVPSSHKISHWIRKRTRYFCVSRSSHIFGPRLQLWLYFYFKICSPWNLSKKLQLPSQMGATGHSQVSTAHPCLVWKFKHFFCRIDFELMLHILSLEGLQKSWGISLGSCVAIWLNGAVVHDNFPFTLKAFECHAKIKSILQVQSCGLPQRGFCIF